MSKVLLKKKLASMPKAEIIGFVVDLYEAKKEAKEYLDYWMNPDEDAKLEEYMKIIRYEFYPPGNREPKTRFSLCKKAISDYKKLKPSAGAVAELMLCLVENACRFTADYGDMWESYYDSVISNFSALLKHIEKSGLFEVYRARLEQCVETVCDCGWGLYDDMGDMFYEMVEKYS